MLIRLRSRRWLCLGVAGCLGLAGLAISPRPAVLAADSTRRPVLVELFTSEGCSSCPPADALLAKLDTQQFVPGVQAIVLSEHVTYWNEQGWTDPFSYDAMTERQRQYGARFGVDSYTPQAVIDGAAQVVGSDPAAVSRAVAQAAASTGVDLSIDEAALDKGAIHFKVKTAAGGNDEVLRKSALTAALAEDSTQSSVKRGENAGRTLQHVAVVRAMQDFGKNGLDGRELSLKLPNTAAGAGPLRLVVFVTDRHSGRVLAAAERTISR